MLIIAETSRLLIRSWMHYDLEEYSELVGDDSDDVALFSTEPCSRAEADLWRYQSEFDKWGWSRWAVVLKETQELIGYCGFAPYNKNIELGWRFLPEYKGVGLVVEAVEAVAAHGLDTLGFDSIISFASHDNRYAQEIMQQSGMSLNRFEGWSNCTVACYSISSPA